MSGEMLLEKVPVDNPVIGIDGLGMVWAYRGSEVHCHSRFR